MRRHELDFMFNYVKLAATAALQYGHKKSISSVSWAQTIKIESISATKFVKYEYPKTKR